MLPTLADKDTNNDLIKHFDLKYSDIDYYIKTILETDRSKFDEKLVS